MPAPEMLSPQREKELAERFDEPETNYNLLKEGVQGFPYETKKPWSERRDTEAILRMYTTFTDKIVGVADGSITERDVKDPRDPERSGEKPDTIIYLDKSGRPVSWFVDAFWEQFAKEGAEKPDSEFLNIDRTNWFMSQGHMREIAERYLGPNDFDIDKVSETDLAAIRAQFVKGDITPENWQKEVWDMETTLDGKNLLIVDEVKNKGGTLSIAVQLLKKAIPDAVVTGKYFWETTTRIINPVTEETQSESAPVWYDRTNDMGRGIGDISLSYYQHEYETNPSQDALRHKIGWKVLSAPHHDSETFEEIEDRKALRLKQDIAYLSHAVADGKILRIPSADRSIDERIAIVEAQGLGIRESTDWSTRSRAIKKRYAAEKARKAS